MAREHRISFEALGTTNAVIAYGDGAPGGLREARRRVLEIHREMNAFSDDSDVSMVSQAAGMGPVRVSADTIAVLEEASRISEATGGAFDVTVRPASALWHFNEGDVRIPSEDETARVRDLVSWRDVSVDERGLTAGLAHAGQSIDLGGIAKGFAADEVRRVLEDHGVADALINLGGNIVTMGSRPDAGPWMVGVQDPTAPTGRSAVSFPAHDKAVVTSGVNERFAIRDGVLYHHVLDPRTCRPAETDLLSVTIVADSAMVADGLATAILVVGLVRGAAIARESGVDAVFVTTDKNVLSTFDTDLA